MNKNVQQLLVLALLAGLLGFLWWRQIQKQTHLPASANPSLADNKETQENENIILKEIVYHAVERDPLLGPLERGSIAAAQTAGETALPQLNVQGLIWGVERPACIIDGKVLSVGDTVQEARITEIKKGGVVFMFKGKIFTVAPKGPLTNVAGAEK